MVTHSWHCHIELVITKYRRWKTKTHPLHSLALRFLMVCSNATHTGLYNLDYSNGNSLSFGLCRILGMVISYLMSFHMYEANKNHIIVQCRLDDKPSAIAKTLRRKQIYQKYKISKMFQLNARVR